MPVAPGTLQDLSAQQSELSNIVQAAERLDLLACIDNRETVVAVVIENDRFVLFLAKKKQPTVADRQIWQTQGRRRQHGQRRSRLSKKDFLRDDLDFLFVILNRRDRGNRTDKNIGVPVRPSAAITARQSGARACERLAALRAHLNDLP